MKFGNPFFLARSDVLLIQLVRCLWSYNSCVSECNSCEVTHSNKSLFKSTLFV